jgi:hypothetical protein
LQAAKAEGKLICARCQGAFARADIVSPSESITETPRKSSVDAAITSRLPADTRITTTPEPDPVAMRTLAQTKMNLQTTARSSKVFVLISSVFWLLSVLGIIALYMGAEGQRDRLTPGIGIIILFIILQVLLPSLLVDPIFNILRRWGLSYGIAMLLLASGALAVCLLLFFTCTKMLTTM